MPYELKHMYTHTAKCIVHQFLEKDVSYEWLLHDVNV